MYFPSALNFLAHSLTHCDRICGGVVVTAYEDRGFRKDAWRHGRGPTNANTNVRIGGKEHDNWDSIRIQDQNECSLGPAWNQCGSHRDCINRVGWYFCQCSRGKGWLTLSGGYSPTCKCDANSYPKGDQCAPHTVCQPGEYVTREPVGDQKWNGRVNEQ